MHNHQTFEPETRARASTKNVEAADDSSQIPRGHTTIAYTERVLSSRDGGGGTVLHTGLRSRRSI